MSDRQKKRPGGVGAPPARTRRVSSMPMSNDTKRRKTRYPGISYRQRKDGRTYSVHHGRSYVKVVGGVQEAILKQGELRRMASRGEAPVTPTRLTFEAVAEQWLGETELRGPYTLR